MVALEIPLDVSQLYLTDDRAFIMWVQALVDRVEVLRREQAARAKG